jgi:hypothetical protein
MGQVLSTVPKLARVERWAYNGLHSLDFSFWYQSRLWDVGMIALLLGGLATSCLGFAMGVKRLRRGTGRLAKALVPSSAEEPARVRDAAALSPTRGRSA